MGGGNVLFWEELQVFTDFQSTFCTSVLRKVTRTDQDAAVLYTLQLLYQADSRQSCSSLANMLLMGKKCLCFLYKLVHWIPHDKYQHCSFDKWQDFTFLPFLLLYMWFLVVRLVPIWFGSICCIPIWRDEQWVCEMYLFWKTGFISDLTIIIIKKNYYYWTWETGYFAVNGLNPRIRKKIIKDASCWCFSL